jgi:hypothetical protein
MRRFGIGMGLAAAALAATAGLALAGAGGVSVEKKSVPFTGDSANVTAHCKHGDLVVGGGFSAPELAQRSAPAGKSAWKVHGTFGALDGTLTSFAVCDGSVGRVKRVSHSKTLGTDEDGDVTAACPHGWHVLGGGFAVAPPFTGGPKGEIAPTSSKRSSARKWETTGTNDGDPTKLVAYALCSKAGGISEESKTKPLAGSGRTTATAKCPRGTHLVGGGYEDPSSDVFRSAPAGVRRWKTTTTANIKPKRSPTAGAARKGVILPTVTSFAYCQDN